MFLLCVGILVEDISFAEHPRVVLRLPRGEELRPETGGKFFAGRIIGQVAQAFRIRRGPRMLVARARPPTSGAGVLPEPRGLGWTRPHSKYHLWILTRPAILSSGFE